MAWSTSWPGYFVSVACSLPASTGQDAFPSRWLDLICHDATSRRLNSRWKVVSNSLYPTWRNFLAVTWYPPAVHKVSTFCRQLRGATRGRFCRLPGRHTSFQDPPRFLLSATLSSWCHWWIAVSFSGHHRWVFLPLPYSGHPCLSVLPAVLRDFVITTHFVITCAFCNKSCAFCNKGCSIL